MTDFLFPHLEPITTHLGFLEAPAERIATHFAEWQDTIFAGRGAPMERIALDLPLEETLRSLLPLQTKRPRRYLLIETTGPWTAFLDSGARGSDPAPLSQLALFLETRAVRAVVRERTTPSQTGKKPFENGRTTIFELFGPKPSPILNALRSVAAMHDGDRRIFEQSGEPLPFEDLTRFEAKAVRDRFGAVDLERYLLALGIDAWDPAFYRPRGSILCTSGHAAAVSGQDLSLEEARARLG